MQCEISREKSAFWVGAARKKGGGWGGGGNASHFLLFSPFPPSLPCSFYLDSYFSETERDRKRKKALARDKNNLSFSPDLEMHP